MYGSENDRARAPWWSLLLVVALSALVLAAPATAGNRQEANVSQSCNAGDSNDDSGDSGGSSSSSGSGDCGNQRRVVQQSAGGSVSRSINQSQSFGGGGGDGGDDDRVRVQSDRDEDDFQTQESASVSATSSDCGDFSDQADAQEALDEGSGDSSELDADDDGRACEEEFTQAVSGAPEGGVETGGGGTLARAGGDSDAVAQVAKIAGPPLALALLVGGLLGLRRGRTA